MEKRNALVQRDTADLETSGDAAIHTKLTAVYTESSAEQSGTEAAKQRKTLQLP